MKSKALIPILSITPLQLKRIFVFALTFGMLKLNAISSVLILSNFFQTISAFGAFEYALSIGLLLSALFNLGVQAAIPFFMLKQKRNDLESVFFGHGLFLVIFFIVSTFIYVVVFNNTFDIVVLSLSIAIIFSMQILASVISKSKEKIFQAVILDSIFFLMLNSYNAYLFLYSKTAEILDVQVLLFVQIGVMSIYYFYNFINSKNNFSWQKYFSVLKFGKPILPGTFLIIFLTTAGKIYAAQFFDLEAVALYGIYFRLAAAIILIHQIANIAFFKKLYASKTAVLDNLFVRFIGFIMILGAIIFFVLPEIASVIFDIVFQTWADSHWLFITLIFQMFFWIGHSLFENIIFRENLAKKYNVRLAILLTIMILVLMIFNQIGILNLENLVNINGITIFFAIESQLKLLKRKEAYFPKTTLIIRLAFALQISFIMLQICIS